MMSTDMAPRSSQASCRDLFTDQQCVSLTVLRTLFGVLGIIACLFLIFVMWVSNKLKRVFYRILLYITICNAVRNLVVAITIDGLTSGHPWCIIQGVLIQFNTWAIILWELCLTVHLFLNSINLGESTTRERFYHLACWGTSSIFTIIPLAASKYGPAITWCWIEDTGWRIGVLYAEYIIIMLIVLILYGKVIYGICTVQPAVFPRQPEEEERRVEIYRSHVRPMIIYPIVIIFEGLIPISFRTSNLAHPNEEPSFVFAVVFAISVILWGLPFVAVYVLDPITRGELPLLRVNFIKKIDKFKRRRTQVRRPNTEHRRQTYDTHKTMSVISIEATTVASPVIDDDTVSEVPVLERAPETASTSDIQES